MNYIVVITCLLSITLLIAWFWRPQLKVEGGIWMILLAYAALGGWALWFDLFALPGSEPDGFAFWKPTVIYWTLAIVLFVAPLINGGYPVKAIFGTFFVLPNNQWRWLNRIFAAIFALLGGVNLLVAFNLSDGDWVGFKYSCLTILLFMLLLRLNLVWFETISRVAIYVYGRAKAFFQ